MKRDSPVKWHWRCAFAYAFSLTALVGHAWFQMLSSVLVALAVDLIFLTVAVGALVSVPGMKAKGLLLGGQALAVGIYGWLFTHPTEAFQPAFFHIRRGTLERVAESALESFRVGGKDSWIGSADIVCREFRVVVFKDSAGTPTVILTFVRVFGQAHHIGYMYKPGDDPVTERSIEGWRRVTSLGHPWYWIVE